MNHLLPQLYEGEWRTCYLTMEYLLSCHHFRKLAVVKIA